ncbi:hypothetical protein, partial [Rhizobium sp. PDO1-076]|uniref:hypothetical protein n=1 Tax=Rhizobium sp. PDO1-076 TaxID=1125979 RepID=UPI001AEC3CDF
SIITTYQPSVFSLCSGGSFVGVVAEVNIGGLKGHEPAEPDLEFNRQGLADGFQGGGTNGGRVGEHLHFPR